MKQIVVPILSFILLNSLSAQELTFRKGTVMDSVRVNDSIPENFSLYLPTSFENKGSWPIIYVFDMQGRGKQALGLFRASAERHGYILAASNSVSDTLSIAQNILISGRMFARVNTLFPIHKDRIYTAGFSKGARFATVIPSFVKNIEGVIAIGSGIPNTDFISSGNSFHFVGIVGKEDFNYTNMRETEKILNRMKFPNQLLVFDEGGDIPNQDLLSEAVDIITLTSMAKGNTPKDENFIEQSYRKNLQDINSLRSGQEILSAYDKLRRAISVYRVHRDIDSLQTLRKQLKKDKRYRAQKRNETNIFFKESLIKEDYKYSLLEDIATLNYNNLGWWNYQMSELEKYEKKENVGEKQMGKRLLGYLNALIEDNIDIELAEPRVNTEAVSFLWQLKTITDPTDYSYYLKIISDSARYEDYGTALFYLEELLKNGYKNKAELYELEHTALFRITPEFNEMVDKYLKDARYELIEE